ncbi:MAG: Bax inhibitor-1/YccA family protein [Akkermansia sp.]|nr:Bax inhibitor-1/YccA family protein [Akkermansia sp.]
MEEQFTQYGQICLTPEQIATRVREYLNKVYAWLAISMVISAGVAIYAENDLNLMMTILENRMLFCIGGLAIVLVMCFAARKLTSGALKVLLLAYSVVQGAVLSPILHFYTNESLGITFACTAGMFGAMAMYGMTTKRNLSGMGRTLFMLLIGLILASLVNLFMGSSMLSLGISAAGVIIFALFTAYDFQQLQAEGIYLADPVDREKGAVLGALGLYINFYNLFLFLLRFLGSAED